MPETLISPHAIADGAETRPSQSIQAALAPPQTSTEAHQPQTTRYKRLSRADEARICRLNREGLNQVQIAQMLGIGQSTVSETLAEWRDTSEDAQYYLKSKALDVAERAVLESDPLDLLERIDVVRPKGNSASGSGLTVQIGINLADLSPASSDFRPALSPAKVRIDTAVSD